MKSVLCFGDSITWGYDPRTAERFDLHTRWPGVMRDELGPGYHVVEEGLCGRMTIWENEFLPGRNGLAVLPSLLASHAPLDLVIVMLGTNDIQPTLGRTPQDVARGAGRLLETVRSSLCGPGWMPPRMLLVAPPPIAGVQGFMRIAFDGVAEKSHELARWYREVALALRCEFVDAGAFTTGSTGSHGDGVHPDADGHRALGIGLAAEVRRILG
jgi:Lysophospholipase L1 and related esterases